MSNDYPDEPGFKVDGPSAEAASMVAGSAKTLRSEVLRVMIRADRPQTADEIAGELRRSILSVRPRVSELHRMGVIRPCADRGTNESGMTATKWEVVRTGVQHG